MANQVTLHMLGLPHLWVSSAHNCCAYSQKIVKACKMFGLRGHRTIVYGNEGSVNAYGEVVEILSERERARFFGPHDPQRLYDLKWDRNEPYWRMFNDRSVVELKKRAVKGDFICTWAGDCQAPIGDHFPGSYSGTLFGPAMVEAGIGYYGTFSNYRVFESHTHMEWVMGRNNKTTEDNFATVCYNYFDPDDFAYERDESVEPYYLFIGRIVDSKGWGTAVETTRAIGAKLVMAGQGDPGKLEPHVTFLGAVGIEERGKLMANATAVFTPTRFREPFGGTAAEAQMAGTPAISTDFGAFTETVEERWRCASHAEFIAAAKAAQTLTAADRAAIKARAMRMFSFDAVAPRYERYLQRIWNLWGNGYYAEEPVVVERSSP